MFKVGDLVYSDYPGVGNVSGIVVEEPYEGGGDDLYATVEVWLNKESLELIADKLGWQDAVKNPKDFYLKDLYKEECSRCEEKSKIDLCNELGDYGACVDAIEHWCKEYSKEHSWCILSDDRGHFLSRIEMALKTLEEALQEKLDGN